jgi:predicted nucleic acid-binding protein
VRVREEPQLYDGKLPRIPSTRTTSISQSSCRHWTCEELLMRSADPTEWEARERERLLERLDNLRVILPIFARELAKARREAARLRVQNRRLIDQVDELRGAIATPESDSRSRAWAQR